jgi:hypothetical protein
MLKHGFPKPNFKGFIHDSVQANWNAILFMVLGTPQSRWLIKNAHVHSIGINHLINTPNKWLNLSYKMNTRFFATSLRIPHPLGMLIVTMLLFIVGGFHLGLLLRHVSMSLTINLTFGIFVSNKGEVSWSMWILLLWTSYDFLFLMWIQNCKMFVFTQVPFAIYLLLCCMSQL